jgi:hypothetical protein
MSNKEPPFHKGRGGLGFPTSRNPTHRERLQGFLSKPRHQPCAA